MGALDSAVGLGVEVRENGCTGASTAENLSVRFILTAGVAGSTGALGALMIGDMLAGR